MQPHHGPGRAHKWSCCLLWGQSGYVLLLVVWPPCALSFCLRQHCALTTRFGGVYNYGFIFCGGVIGFPSPKGTGKNDLGFW